MAKPKIVLIIMDGLGDRPVKALGGKTPLEAASTPNLDLLAKEGMCGLMLPVYHTAIPTSEEGHLSLFGYSTEKYPIRRGYFTAMGSGIKIKKGDVCLRGNFGTVDEKMNVIDRRAGRIDRTQPLIEAINGMVIDGVKFLVKYAGGHRVGIVMRGKNLSPNISDGDPHYGKLQKGLRKIVPLDKTKKAKFTASVLNKFLEKSHLILKNHPFNKKRESKGLLSANYILVRGASSYIKLPSFKKRYGFSACCIAGKVLYQQIGKALGMKLIKVKGADGSPKTNLKGKFSALRRNIKKYDFVFLHIKATDSLAEDGDCLGKKKFIEKVDRYMRFLLDLNNTLIIVTADHSTCCQLRRHCSAPIPILIYGADKDKVSCFSEKACKNGKLGTFCQLKLMSKVVYFYKKLR
ncbi:MAG TPA: 2,3-bisphosphoglycerate-independent phosphoglycerate mutase [bacterium]|nr:2,3-bisphosphoglycerate-independent phosphoglycerate mutase [bacterium]